MTDRNERTSKYRTEIQQMMFVSGETGDPDAETTSMIEMIVQEQVKEMLLRCTVLAARRGVRTISIHDLMFQYRHDKAKIARLKNFLSWKDVRKNVKDSDDKGGADAADIGADDDVVLGAGIMPGTGPSGDAVKKTRRAKVELPWDVHSFFNETVPPRDDEEDEEAEDMNYATLQRLKNADERTKNMTRDEYVHWSDCRQASFTFRKGKRFREWAGFGVVTDSKPNDDIIDILGFLTFEIVQTLTEEALKVKEAEDAWKKETGGETSKASNAVKKRKHEGGGLFDPPEEERTPVQERHVIEGFRRLQYNHPQTKRRKAEWNGCYRGLQRTPLHFVSIAEDMIQQFNRMLNSISVKHLAKDRLSAG